MHRYPGGLALVSSMTHELISEICPWKFKLRDLVGCKSQNGPSSAVLMDSADEGGRLRECRQAVELIPSEDLRSLRNVGPG